MSKLALKERLTQGYDYRALYEIIGKLEDQVNRLTEGRASAYHGAGTAAPTTGAWVAGDWIKVSNPTSAGYFGYVCTVSGTPGTWRGFGVIA